MSLLSHRYVSLSSIQSPRNLALLDQHLEPRPVTTALPPLRHHDQPPALHGSAATPVTPSALSFRATPCHPERLVIPSEARNLALLDQHLDREQ